MFTEITYTLHFPVIDLVNKIKKRDIMLTFIHTPYQ